MLTLSWFLGILSLKEASLLIPAFTEPTLLSPPPSLCFWSRSKNFIALALPTLINTEVEVNKQIVENNFMDCYNLIL